MLKLLKRWLGWEENSDYFDPDDFRTGGRQRSATAQVLASTRSKPQPNPGPRGEPSLDFDKGPPEPHFDPYNTGKFDRSASWERISKNNR